MKKIITEKEKEDATQKKLLLGSIVLAVAIYIVMFNFLFPSGDYQPKETQKDKEIKLMTLAFIGGVASILDDLSN
jgi:uncharacterized ion transporter superfamily protein YfcC